ncbi:MAG: ABC transporter transmembrane domain-containing protein [Syntrophobacteraceae bacterium]
MKSADRRTYKRMIDMVRPYRTQTILAMLCMMGVGGTTAAGAYLIKNVLDDIFINRDQTMLVILPLGVLALFTVKGVCMWGNVFLTNRISNRMITRLRQQLYDHIQTLSLSFFDKKSTGDLMSRVLNDVAFLQASATSAVVGVMRECFSIIGLLAVIFFRDWQLACIAIAVLPFGFYPVVKLSKMLRKIGASGQASLADISVILHETIGGTRIVKAFGMEEYEKKRFQEKNERTLRLQLKTVAVAALSSPIMEFLGGVVIVLTIWYGGASVIKGTTTTGNFFSFVAALLLLYEPVKRLNNTVGMLPLGMAAADRVYEILDIPPEIGDKPGAAPLAPIQRGIEFRNASFTYGDKPVLKNINLKATVGEIVAIVGTSGAGKTTLVNLLPRFYDVTGGAVLIDGVDIRDVTLASLRSQIGIVTQQSILFNDTVRNNIAYGDIARSEEEIVAAAKAANAYDFIMKMPKGFDSKVGEAGVRLSGGERQRICIARAILKNAPILILDEATSSLDSESEREVQNALEYLMTGRTTFVIAHRLSTIKNADRIIAMADGTIIEEGRHDQLLRTGSEYRRLYELQLSQLQLGMDLDPVEIADKTA